MTVIRLVGPSALAVLVTLVSLVPAPAGPPASEPTRTGTGAPDDAAAITPVSYRARVFPDHLPDVVKSIDDSITTELAQYGGRLLPYYLPDLVQYVDDDVERLLKFLKKLRGEHPEQVTAEVQRKVPEYTALGRRLKAAGTSDSEKWKALNEKTVVFQTSDLTDENAVAALDTLWVIRDEVRKIDLSYSAVTGRSRITESALAVMGRRAVPIEVRDGIRFLMNQDLIRIKYFKNIKERFPLLDEGFFYHIKICSNIFLYVNIFINLTDIDLSSVPLSSYGWGVLADQSTPQVRQNNLCLWLRGTTIDQGDLKNLLQKSSDKLELLSLADLTVTRPVIGSPLETEKVPADVWADDFVHVKFRALKFLSLAKNKLTDEILGQMDLNRLERLEGLDLADNPDLTDRGLSQLRHGKPSTSDDKLERAKLTELSIAGTGRPKDGKGTVTEAGVRSLLTWNQDTLTSLNLSGTATLADPRSPVINALRQMDRLAALNVASTGITDDGLRAIWERGNGLAGLITLDLSNTRVTDGGLINRTDEVGFPKLKTIRIGAADLRITTGGVSRRNALLTARFPLIGIAKYSEFNFAKLVKPAQ